MNNYLDFTFDPVNYPPSQMNDFVNQLHANHQHYIIITDPGISYTAKNYPPLDEGNKLLLLCIFQFGLIRKLVCM